MLTKIVVSILFPKSLVATTHLARASQFVEVSHLDVKDLNCLQFLAIRTRSEANRNQSSLTSIIFFHAVANLYSSKWLSMDWIQSDWNWNISIYVPTDKAVNGEANEASCSPCPTTGSRYLFEALPLSSSSTPPHGCGTLLKVFTLDTSLPGHERMLSSTWPASCWPLPHQHCGNLFFVPAAAAKLL
jgi:hypothetical protein